MIKQFYLASIIFIITLSMSAFADDSYLYRDYLTGFQDISSFPDSSGTIKIDKPHQPVSETRAFNIKNADFKYTIRLRTSENPTRKFRFVKRQLEASTYGLIWDYLDKNNYSALVIKRKEHNRYDDITAVDAIELSVVSVKRGVTNVLYSDTRQDLLSHLESDYNTFEISYVKGAFSISAGHDFLRPFYTTKNIHPADTCRIGYFIHAKGLLEIKRIKFQSFKHKEELYRTAFSKEDLDAHFKLSKDPIEGYWKFLDRNTDDKAFLLGGKYTIAIIKNDLDKYDILYVGGAQKYQFLWTKWMKKGSLYTTSFHNHYDLIWHEARKTIISDETYAVFENNILSLFFPIQKSQVRFYKVNDI